MSRAMDDGAIAISFVNGAVRTSDQLEMARLAAAEIEAGGGLRRVRAVGRHSRTGQSHHRAKTSCAKSTAITPPADRIPRRWAHPDAAEACSTPCSRWTARFRWTTTCPAARHRRTSSRDAFDALLGGELPEPGTVLAPDHAMCDECPRKDTRPQELKLDRFHRVQERVIETGHLHPGAGCALPGPGDARRLRRALHSRQHAVHRLFRTHQPRARLRRQGAVRHRLRNRAAMKRRKSTGSSRASSIRSGRSTGTACRRSFLERKRLE